MLNRPSVLKRTCLEHLDFATLTQNNFGLERETLRVDAEGRVAASDHPLAIGHKLTHPSITVDFSEGLLELVTSPHAGSGPMFSELHNLHSWVARHLDGGEMLWPMSMPPAAHEGQIRIADFGPSASARMKQIYRQGLASRYGKIMQIIAGVHFNFSFDPRFLSALCAHMGLAMNEQECRNQVYFRLIRGFDQHAWILPFLFGASPIAARSSLAQPADWLQSLDEQHVFGEFATSLRMSDIGYQSPAQSDLNISHRDLNEYVRELVLATRTPWPAYEALGTQAADQWIQLNGNILQIENEYYSAIRPKQIAQRGERPACALYNRGVSYIEVRMLDVDPFDPLGLSADSAHFMEVFLLACLAWGEDGSGRPKIDKHNRTVAIRYGRKPGVRLMRGASSVALRHWLDECLDDCAVIAEQLDQAHGNGCYAQAVKVQRDKWQAPETLPSQRVLEAGRDGHYQDWARDLAQRYTAGFAANALDSSQLDAYAHATRQSLEQATALPPASPGEVEAYVEEYFASVCDDMLASLL